MTPTPLVAWILCIALLPVCAPAAPAQEAPADSAVPGTLDLHRDGNGSGQTDEEKIADLNAKLARNPRDARSWNDLGVIYAGMEEYALARDAFINAVQASPTEADYHRNLGVAFSRLDMPELALREFEAYRRFDQLGAKDVWRLIGGAQARAGMVDEARATYRDGIAAMGTPLNAEGLRLALALHKIEAENGDETDVRDLLDEFAPVARDFLATAREGDDGYREAQALIHYRVELLVEDGKLMEGSGLYAEAAAKYEAAYELSPDRDDLLPRLVDVHLKAGEIMEAKVAARLARETHPEQAGTWIATAKVYEQTDRLEDAVTAYQQAFAIEPEFPDLRLAIGNLLMRVGRDKEAAEYLREGVTSSDTNPEVLYNYAVSQIREENYHAAIASLRKVVAELPDYAPAWSALAQCLRVTKQYAAAVEPYQRALELQLDPKLAYNLGICAQRAEDWETAVAAYDQALAMDPGMVEARYNLSLTYMKAKRYEEAVASFELMKELEPDSYRVYYSQGLSYFYLGRYDEALAAYDAAAEQKETRELLNNIGLVYDAKGEKKTAAKWYKMAKELEG